MDTVTLAHVLDVLASQGKNTDAAGTSTLFARLAQIAGYVDTLEATTNTLDTRTNSMDSRLVNNLGSDADVASATGSVHAKIKDLKSNGAVNWANKTPVIRQDNAPAVGTIFSVTGSGYLLSCQLSMTSTSSTSSIDVYIDGTKRVTLLRSTVDTRMFVGPLRFNTSLRIDAAATNAVIVTSYCLD